MDEAASATPTVPERLTRAEQRARSVSAILDTAIRLFAERGYTGVSLDEIAAAAGLKRTLLLHYFKSKEELWRAAATEVCTAFNEGFARRLAAIRGKHDEERLHATLAASLQAFLEKPDFPRFLVREGGVHSERLQWLVEHFNYAEMEYGSPAVQAYVGGTIARDALFAVLLGMSALGPLMEASLSRVSGRKRSGVHPMTKANRAALARLMTGFIVSMRDPATS